MKIKKKILMQVFILLIMSGLVVAFTTIIRDTTSTFNIVNATHIVIEDSGTNVSFSHVNTTNLYAGGVVT